MSSQRTASMLSTLTIALVVGSQATAARAEDMLQLPGSWQLAANKQAAVKAARDYGATDEEVAMIVAIGMQETDNFCCDERDASKDGGAAANYTAFNVNHDMLSLVYGNLDFSRYNGPDSMTLGVRAILDAARKWGMDRFLAFHRGGRTAFDDGKSYGADEYKASVHSVAQFLMANKQHLTDPLRVCHNTPHV